MSMTASSLFYLDEMHAPLRAATVFIILFTVGSLIACFLVNLWVGSLVSEEDRWPVAGECIRYHSSHDPSA